MTTIYTKEDLIVLKNNPWMKGKRHKMHQMIQESSQDPESKMTYEVFV